MMMGQVRNPDCNSHTKPKGMHMCEYLPQWMQKQISPASLQQVLFYTVSDLISVQGQSPFI